MISRHRFLFIGALIAFLAVVVIPLKPHQPLVTVIVIPLVSGDVGKILEKHNGNIYKKVEVASDCLPRKVKMKRGIGDGD